jgi:hypothetical protein
MINRSLIRIKTVQILYSYLLTRKEFKLEPAPGEGASRDTLFAYSVYIDFIILLLKLSGIPLGTDSGIILPSDPAIKKNRLGAALRSDASVCAALESARNNMKMFDSCIPDLMTSIAATKTYADYKRKRKLELVDDMAFWREIFTLVIRKNKSVERALRRHENFSHVGFETGMKMFMDTISSFDDTQASYLKARKDLDDSLKMAYDLYHALMILPVRLTEAYRERIEANKNKNLPTEADLNPDMRLLDNLYIKAIERCEPLMEYVSENPDADPSEWRDSDLMYSRLLKTITDSDIYKTYLGTAEGDFATDAAFWRDIMRSIVFPSEELDETMESKSVYWNDDLDIMSTFVLKTMRRTYAAAEASEEDGDGIRQTPGEIVMLPKFMNRQDEVFGSQLFDYVVNNRETYRSYINRFIDTKSWDSERLAFMDIVLMMTAIAEVVNYPSIPVPVTLNEYIEIANNYSTPRSGQFINGILYSVIKALNEEGVINKK